MIYLSIFIVAGLVGWAIDTAYRTWDEKQFAPNTWIPFFSLIYGFNGVFLYVLFNFFSVSFIVDVAVGFIISNLVEIVSGLIALKFLKKRFWDYRSSQFHFRGFIDLEHSFYWLILTALCRFIYTLF